MTKMQKRRSEIIKMLSELSRNGWEAAKEYDYKPLERELAAIEGKL